MPGRDLRPRHSVSQISQWNYEKGQGQKEYEDVRKGLRRVAGKKPRNSALFNGKAGKNESEDPTAKRQQQQRPRDQQQPGHDRNLKDGRQAPDTG